jgi:hypothetical protein
MSTIKDLREVADEIQYWENDTPTAARMHRWANTIREFTETPRCPRCGTSVAQKQRVAPEDGPSNWCECVACGHDSGLHLTEQDALKAFYGDGE